MKPSQQIVLYLVAILSICNLGFYLHDTSILHMRVAEMHDRQLLIDARQNEIIVAQRTLFEKIRIMLSTIPRPRMEVVPEPRPGKLRKEPFPEFITQEI